MKLLVLLLMSIFSFSSPKVFKGEALLEYSVFKIDIYKLRYFEDSKNHRLLEIKYLVDVKKEYSQEGWKQGLAPLIKESKEFKKQLDWLVLHSIDIKKNDTIKIHIKNNLITLSKNDSVYATKVDKKLAKTILYPWLGEFPIDAKIKNNLLNGNKL